MFALKTLMRISTGGLKIILPLLALYIGFSSYMSLKTHRPTPPKQIKHETVHPIRSSQITLASHQPVLKLYGEIKAGRKVELRALVAGKVLETGVNFREGLLVKKDELLLAIDPFSYQGAVVEAKSAIVEARARLKEITAQIKAEEDSLKYAREQLQLSRRDFERAQKLVRRGSVTRQGVDQRALVVSQRRQAMDGKSANLIILRAKAEQQNAGLDSLRWRLRQAERNHRDTRLKAPFDGYISEHNANRGKLLNVNDRVAVLLDNNWMDVLFTLSDRQYGRLIDSQNLKRKNKQGGIIGRTIVVTWQLGEKQLKYEAMIERVGAQISSETAGVSVYARLKNPSQPQPIRTGAFVDVELRDRTYHKVARLPQTSLYQRTKVYVVGADNRLSERQVKLRAIDGGFVLVSGDLADGERVVTTRLSTIGGGLLVQDLRGDKSTQKKPGRMIGGQTADELSKVENKDELVGSARDSSWKPTLGGAPKSNSGQGSGGSPGAERSKKQQGGGPHINKKDRQNRG